MRTIVGVSAAPGTRVGWGLPGRLHSLSLSLAKQRKTDKSDSTARP